ncbi:hypothetical protein MED297_21127 [Reinekea sp. MED297]|uniref:ATP-binding protein n=1 Tax=Reinekea blandensis MED297 TaxID=314283 RepID=A4B9Y0_9GAMM|nr:hypothetical protein MED297_21127 [Reinekea sp. MED297] [Reinekea blandensis MED297]
MASGKTTYARRKEAEGQAIFLSIDALQLSVLGPSPTREQLDASYDGARAYQFSLALTLLNRGIDVYFDWGLWQKAERQRYKRMLEQQGVEVDIIYFDVPAAVRMDRNAQRNRSNDDTSFKIEPHDVRHFDSLYEVPSEDEYDVLVAD